MTKQYLLLCPVSPAVIDTREPEFSEALEEFGLSYTVSANQTYITAKTLEALAQAAFTLELPGNIIEYTGEYDSNETEMVTETEKG